MFNGSGREGSRGGKGVGCVVGREGGGGRGKGREGCWFLTLHSSTTKTYISMVKQKREGGIFFLIAINKQTT